MTVRFCIALALATVLAHADEPATKSSANKSAAAASKKKAATKSAAPTTELKLPAGAIETDPGTFTYTDSQGKKWIYRKTPFGLARSEDKPAAAEVTPAAPAITAIEDGDTIRFERPSPFGVYKWQKKKSDLTDDERAAWERSQRTSAGDKAKQE